MQPAAYLALLVSQEQINPFNSGTQSRKRIFFFMMLLGIGFYQWSLNPMTFRTQCGRSDGDGGEGHDDDDDGHADHDLFCS